MELSTLLRKLFDINRNKTIPDRIKSVKTFKVKNKIKRFNIGLIKKVALDEMQSSNKGRMYKLFCQCIVLTGRVE